MKFGVEIEFLSRVPSDQVATILTQAGITTRTAYYSDTSLDGWKIKPDASLSAGTFSSYHPMELVSPPLDSYGAGFETVRRVCEVLNGATIQGRINRSCGLHVHVEAATMSLKAIKKLAVAYSKSEPFLDQVVPPSRRGNAGFNHSVTSPNITRLQEAKDVYGVFSALCAANRHSKLNLSAFRKHKTVEFRHHSGTTDATKIINWAELAIKMVKTAMVDADGPAATWEYSGRPASASYQTDIRVFRGEGFRIPYRRRVARRVFQLASRPDGVTVIEAQEALGNSNPINIPTMFDNANISYRRRAVRFHGRGRPEYRYFVNDRPVATMESSVEAEAVTVDLNEFEIATFESLMDKFNLTPAEKSYWEERRAELAA